MLQQLNDCYLIPGQCGKVGHSSRDRDGRAWVHESSRAPRVHGQPYTTVQRCADGWVMAAGLPLGWCQVAAAD